MRQLEDPLGLTQIAKTVDAEGEERGSLGDAAGEEVGGGAGDDDLAAVGQRPQPGAPDDAGAGVVAPVADLALASVQRHPHTEDGVGGPRFLHQGLLRLQGGGDGVGRPGEGGHQAVALALLDGSDSTVSGDGALEDPVMAGHRLRHLRTMRLPHPGRSFDVRQQERHRPRREWHVVLSCDHPALRHRRPRVGFRSPPPVPRQVGHSHLGFAHGASIVAPVPPNI